MDGGGIIAIGVLFIIFILWFLLVDAGWKHTDRKHKWMNEQLELRKRVKRHREWEDKE